jgi:carboxyl-terminal processing protease
MRKAMLALTAIVIGAACWLLFVKPKDGNTPALSDIQGVWKSAGYGYLLRGAEDGTELFHTAGDFCYADPKSAIDQTLGSYRPSGPAAIAFSVEPGDTQYVFDRLPDLPQACADATPWSQPRIAALVAATMSDLYPSFQRRGIDWRARVAAAEPSFATIADDEALFAALKSLLAGIEDPHLELHGDVDGDRVHYTPGEGVTLTRALALLGGKSLPRSEWIQGYRHGILRTVLGGGGRQRLKDQLIWGRVGDIGYLNLASMEGLSVWSWRDDKSMVDVALDEAIAAFAGTRAVIVDVTYNLGGYDSVSRHVAGRFADRRRLAYTKVAFAARGVAPQPFYVEPSTRSRYLGPVYLLTSDVTVSAAETFTLFMRALPNVVHVGGTTRGALSDMTEKPLPNGWQLNLPAEIYRDPEGRNFEVAGIPPQVKREVFPPNDLAVGHARAVLALMDDIRSGTVVPKAARR